MYTYIPKLNTKACVQLIHLTMVSLRWLSVVVYTIQDLIWELTFYSVPGNIWESGDKTSVTSHKLRFDIKMKCIYEVFGKVI